MTNKICWVYLIEKNEYPEKGDWVKSVNVNKLNEY